MPSVSATASRVRSSSGGAPAAHAHQNHDATSPERGAYRIHQVLRGGRPTVMKATVTPNRLSRSVRNREFVSCRKGVRSSEPIATISAVMEEQALCQLPSLNAPRQMIETGSRG